MTEQAFDEQKKLTHLRFKRLQQNPVFGQKTKQKEAMNNIKELSNTIKGKLDEFILIQNQIFNDEESSIQFGS